MAVKIDFHYDLSILAHTLAENIQAQVRSASHPLFEPVCVIIPIDHFKAWLPLQVAAGTQHKVAANLKFQYMETALWEMLIHLAPADLKDAVRLDKESTALRVLKILTDLQPENPGELAPFRDYLYATGGQGKKAGFARLPDFEKRVWNLSIQLAGLLLDYEYHRQNMVKSWRSGKLHTTVDMEQSQMALYRVVFPENNPSTGLTLPQLADAVFKKVEKPAGKKVVHFFGFSELSRKHIEIMWRLGVHFNIHIYQFNVCREFWEDVTTRQEDRKLFLKRVKDRMKLGGGAEEEKLDLKDDKGTTIPDNPLLKAWGKPGRELLKGFSEAADSLESAETESFHPEFDNWQGERNNLLYRLQGQVLDRLIPEEDKEEPHTMGQDKNIQIAACSDIYREVETVYNSILWNMDKDKQLKSTDITVLVSDMARYKPVIQSVFSRKGNTVPFNLTDSTAEKESVYGQAVTAILGLAGGAFSRSDLFEIFYNPCFMQAAGAARPDVDQWAEWARSLNIYRWAGKEHKKEDIAGDFSPDLYTWEWGLKRLRLGRIMVSDDWAENFPPFSDLESRDAASVSRFSGTVECLLRRLRRFSESGSRKPGTWATELKDLFENFLAIPRDRKEEAAVRNALFEALDSFVEHAEHIGLELSFNLVRELVTGSLSEVTSRIGTYGSGGITVASIKNARPIPFQLIYILGLEEKSFPADSVRSTLDLRTQKRKIGDISPRDHDLFRFLEAFMSSRKKLYLTYIGQDLQKDETFQPSSAIKQLLYAMNPILKDSKSFPGEIDYGVKYKGFKMPLHGFSERYMEVLPEYFDLCVNYSDNDRELLKTSAQPAGRQDSPSPEQARNVKTISVEQKSSGPEIVKIKLTDLRRFLLNPVDAQVRYHLNLNDDEVLDPVEVTDEPFYSSFPVDYNLITDTLKNCLHTYDRAGKVLIENEFKMAYETNRTKGAAADAGFGIVDGNQLLVKVNQIWNTYLANKNSIGNTGTFYRSVSLGNTWKEDTQSLGFPAMTVEGKTVEFSAELENVWLDEDKHLEFIKWKKSAPKKNEYDNLDGFLFASLLQYLTGSESLVEQQIIIGPGKLQPWQFSWENKNACKSFIESLVKRFLKKDSFEWLPLEIVLEKYKKSGLPEDKVVFKNELIDAVHEKIEDKYSRFPDLSILELLNVHLPEDSYDWSCELRELLLKFKPATL